MNGPKTVPGGTGGGGRELPVALLTPLSAGSGIPRYRQIADQIETLLGDAAAGVRLPSEHEIANHLAVSRATSTQALRELQNRGVAMRMQGRGTYSSGRTAVRSLGAQRLPSFSDDLRRAGHTTRERVLRCATEPAPDSVARQLGVPGGSPTWLVERVIISDGVPVVHVTSWLPSTLYPEVDAAEVQAWSLYEHLERSYGAAARPERADEEWAAVTAAPATAQLLELPRYAAVMRVHRLAMLDDGTSAEYGVSYVRGDSFVVSWHVSGDIDQRLAPRLRTDGST